MAVFFHLSARALPASVYYTEHKPKNKKTKEAWERGYRYIVIWYNGLLAPLINDKALLLLMKPIANQC